MLPLKRRFCGSQIVIITNYVVVSSVGIKRVVCIQYMFSWGNKTTVCLDTPLIYKHYALDSNFEKPTRTLQ